MFDLNKKMKVDVQLILLLIIFYILIIILVKRVFSRPTVYHRGVQPWNGWWDWEEESVSDWPNSGTSYSLG